MKKDQTMRTTLFINPKPFCLMTMLLAASLAPLQAAPHHGTRHHPTSADRADSRRPMLRLDPGYRLHYQFDMGSQALLDMRNALQQQDPHANPSRAPKLSLVTELKGGLEMVPIRTTEDRIQVLCTLQPDLLRLSQNGLEITAPLAQLKEQLTQPVLVEYTRRGQILSARFDPRCEATAQGFLRTLLAYLQITLPEDRTSPAWKAREEEPNGIFNMTYARQAATATTWTLCKAKLGSCIPDPRAGSGEQHVTQSVVPAGSLNVTIDPRTGLIQAVRGEERFETSLNTATVSRSRNTIALTLSERKPLSASQNLSLLRIAQERVQQGAGVSLAQAAEITPGQEAQIQRANLGNATAAQILSQLAQLDTATEAEKQARQLLPQLKAAIYLHPEVCETLKRQLLTARPEQIRMAVIAEALRAAGSPPAQQTLLAALQARHTEGRTAALLLPTLARLQQPIPQVDQTLQGLAFGKGDPFVASTACLALGSLARILAPSAPERADRITQRLQHELQHAGSSQHKHTLLLALANAAQPSTLPTLLKQAHDRSPRSEEHTSELQS